MNVPNIQTSLAVVNRLKLMDSGAIHLIGSLPLDAEKQMQENKEFGSCEDCFFNLVLGGNLSVRKTFYLCNKNYLPCTVKVQNLPI